MITFSVSWEGEGPVRRERARSVAIPIRVSPIDRRRFADKDDGDHQTAASSGVINAFGQRSGQPFGKRCAFGYAAHEVTLTARLTQLAPHQSP